MKIGIMQPYFFPYIGYFQLINYVDEWIFFDVVQYNKKSWMNRNKILHPDRNKEFQYITVPIKKHKRGTLIKNIIINNEQNWKDNLRGRLTLYKRLRAPYYDDVMKVLNCILDKEFDYFLNLIIESTKGICNYLDIELNYKIASEIDFNYNSIKEPGDWALEISKKQSANQYINPSGGYNIFNENKYLNNGVDLLFLKSNLSEYKQSRREKFIKGLSIIDIIMFNDKEKIKKMLLNDFKLLKKNDLNILKNK